MKDAQQIYQARLAHAEANLVFWRRQACELDDEDARKALRAADLLHEQTLQSKPAIQRHVDDLNAMTFPPR